MDDVLGAHDQFHRAADWHVQLVDLALSAHVLDFPHPLLPDDEYLHRTVGDPVQIEEDFRSPREHAHADEERNGRPQELERERPVDGDANLVVTTPAIPERKEDHEAGDEQGEEGRDRHHEEIDGVDLSCLYRGLLRKQR